MQNQWLALQVVIPLLAAPACALMPRARLAWAFTLLIAWATFAVSWILLDRVLTGGTLSYDMGGWAAPYGIEYRVDAANAYVLLVVAAIGALVATYAPRSVDSEIERGQQPLFYAALLLCLAGLLGIAITGDVFNLFVFLEISSLSSYILISQGRDRRSLTAAYQYLIMGTIGATFFLIGVGLVYVLTGTLNMADLAERLPAVAGTRTGHTAFAFLFVGLSLKVALFPLHLWLPNAYSYAPSVVTAFLAATATKVALYVLLRITFWVFGGTLAFELAPLSVVLLLLALLGIFVASIVATYQHDAKRLLAYSSVAQIGYMLLGASFATAAGVTATMLHLFNHALMKGALFLALGCVMWRIGSTRLVDMRGLGHTMPWTMGAFVVGGLSLIGVPLTAGFISKWYLVSAALQSGLWPVGAAVLVSSLIAIVYIWRVIETAYFQTPQGPVVGAREAPLSLLIPTWVLAAANVYFGVHTDLTVGVASSAALQLINGVSP